MTEQELLKQYELSLILGKPANIDNLVKVYSPTIGEIEEVGQEVYDQFLSLILFDKETIEHLKDVEESNFEIVYTNCFHSSEYAELFKQACLFFFKEELQLGTSNGKPVMFVSNDENRKINSQTFNKIQSIVKLANKIEIKKETGYNPANAAAKKMIEKIKKNKKKPKPKKKNEITLQSIVSGIAWRSNSVNIFDIQRLTVYQVYDGFYRIENIDNYQNVMTGIFTGSIDQKKIKLAEINWAKTI